MRSSHPSQTASGAGNAPLALVDRRRPAVHPEQGLVVVDRDGRASRDRELVHLHPLVGDFSRSSPRCSGLAELRQQIGEASRRRQKLREN